MTTDPDCTSFDDLEVIWGEEYIYSLMTVNTLEICSWSNQIQLLVPGSAPTPSYLEVSEILVDRVSLGWTVCPDTDFEKYVLYRSTSPDIMLDPDEADLIEVFYHGIGCVRHVLRNETNERTGVVEIPAHFDLLAHEHGLLVDPCHDAQIALGHDLSRD